MRIYGTNGTAPVGSPPTARRSVKGAFTLTEEEAPRPSASAPALRAVEGIDALIALQGIEDPTERRRRAVTRGRTALDVLDELKIGLLAGTLDRATLDRLRLAAAGLKDSSGDSVLDGVIAEIDLRVEVEIAKIDSA